MYVIYIHTVVNWLPGEAVDTGLCENVLNDICNALISLFKANIICLLLCWVIYSHFRDAGSFNNWQSNPLRQPLWKLSGFITLEKICHFYFHSIVSPKSEQYIFFQWSVFMKFHLDIFLSPWPRWYNSVKFEKCFLCCSSKTWHYYSRQIQKKKWHQEFKRWKQCEIEEFMIWDGEMCSWFGLWLLTMAWQ